MSAIERFEIALAGYERCERIVDALGAGTIDRYDREESGGGEYEQGGGAHAFSNLERGEQAAILHALDVNLPTRTTRPNRNTPTSYGIKHAVERYVGFYVSNLQLKTAMRILGYTRSADALNPCYNITKREWRAFSERAREIADARNRAWRALHGRG